MAYAITNTIYTLPLMGATGTPAANEQLADQTATTAAIDFGAAYKWFRAVVYIKTYVVGTATVGPILELQVAQANYSTNVVTVATYNGGNVASATAGQTVILTGYYPLVAGAQYCKLVATLSGNSTVAFDAFLDAF